MERCCWVDGSTGELILCARWMPARTRCSLSWGTLRSPTRRWASGEFAPLRPTLRYFVIKLKAIKQAADCESAEVWVMAPLISTVDEVRNFTRAARTEGLPIIGVMIETPAAVIQAEQILAEVDFVSIGTNDLAQYTFAADRHSASLASLNDPWQPELLRMIKMGQRRQLAVARQSEYAARLQLIRCSRAFSPVLVIRASSWHRQRSLSSVPASPR
jgi:PEP-utilising enzyme, PEP-binding domain